MKILIVRNTPDVLSYEKQMYNLQEIGLARALNQKGYSCDVVYAGGRSQRRIEILYAPGRNFTLYYLRSIGVAGSALFFGLDALIAQYDIVQSGGYDQPNSWRLARRYPEKVVIYHGSYYSPFNRGFNLRCRVADTLFLPLYRSTATTFLTKSVLAGEFLRGKGLSDITDIGVGFDPEQMTGRTSMDTGSELLQRLQMEKKSGASLLLYIGKLEERRNILFLIEVLHLVAEKDPSVKMVLVGTGEENYQRLCVQKIEEYRLTDHVISCERLPQEKLPPIYRSCDVFLLPTRYEIFGMVLLEAMYYGMPVVTTRNGGSSMLVEDGVNGFILPEDHADVWLERILRLLNDPKQAATVGERAHVRIAEQFTWNSLADRFLECYARRCGHLLPQ